MLELKITMGNHKITAGRVHNDICRVCISQNLYLCIRSALRTAGVDKTSAMPRAPSLKVSQETAWLLARAGCLQDKVSSTSSDARQNSSDIIVA